MNDHFVHLPEPIDVDKFCDLYCNHVGPCCNQRACMAKLLTCMFLHNVCISAFLWDDYGISSLGRQNLVSQNC